MDVDDFYNQQVWALCQRIDEIKQCQTIEEVEEVLSKPFNLGD